jgi:hypothetical protein
MTRKTLPVSLLVSSSVALLLASAVPATDWKPADPNRPHPPKVTPPIGDNGAPSDAIRLFSGKDLAAWQHAKGKPADWKLADDYMEVVPGTGDLQTKEPYGDCQLHVEWAARFSPFPAEGARFADGVVIKKFPPAFAGQWPGNSGVILMSLYEIQILESYENTTYADGQAAAVYCQYPPLVNASLPLGQWQTYDIVFHAPRFSDDGALQTPATITLLHNGVLVQDHVSLTGPTTTARRPPYKAHAAKLPLTLQDHLQPVRYRNIWIRPLEEGK